MSATKHMQFQTLMCHFVLFAPVLRLTNVEIVVRIFVYPMLILWQDPIVQLDHAKTLKCVGDT